MIDTVHVSRADTWVRPYGVKEMLTLSETSAPSVIFASKNATSPVTSDGGGFKLGVGEAHH